MDYGSSIIDYKLPTTDYTSEIRMSHFQYSTVLPVLTSLSTVVHVSGRWLISWYLFLVIFYDALWELRIEEYTPMTLYRYVISHFSFSVRPTRMEITTLTNEAGPSVCCAGLVVSSDISLARDQRLKSIPPIRGSCNLSFFPLSFHR